MAINRSTFTAENNYQIDTFPELFDLPPERVGDARRLKELAEKTNKTQDEITEMSNLLISLKDYYINPETWNKLCDCIKNMEEKILLEKTIVDNAVSTGVNTINRAKDDALTSIEQKKENIITYMDSTTAGKIRNDIGILGDLPTNDKSSLVNAIIEVDNRIDVLSDSVDTHLADYTLQVPYAVATGSANAYSITLNPAPTSYVEGMAIAVKINVQNTGASTINVNGLGAKTIKKANGNDVSSGNLKAGGIYTLRYDGVNFILQGEGGEYGTATPDKVLSGYTIGTENGIVAGTMFNKSGVSQPASNYTVNGTTLYVNPSIDGYVDGFSSITVNEPNLIPVNIKEGISIFGVTGSFDGKRLASGTATLSGPVKNAWNYEYVYSFRITGLGFYPTKVIIIHEGNILSAVLNLNGVSRGIIREVSYSGQIYNNQTDCYNSDQPATSPAYGMFANGFYAPVRTIANDAPSSHFNFDKSVYWLAIE